MVLYNKDMEKLSNPLKELIKTNMIRILEEQLAQRHATPADQAEMTDAEYDTYCHDIAWILRELENLKKSVKP
jgi:hypothetical protein